jgi:protein TonB
MHDYASRRQKPTRWWVNLSLVLALHALLLWAINAGLAHKFVKIAKAPVQALLLEESQPDILPPPPPPPPPPKNLPPPPPPPAYVPPVEVQVSTPPPVNAIAAVSNKPQAEAPPSPLPVVSNAPPAPPAPPAAPVRTSAVGILCTPPDYPSWSLRLEEEGKVSLSYLVGVDGSVVKVDVLKSSGYKRLDTAASQQVFKWRFKPATLDGKAIEQSITRSFNFSISNDVATKSNEPTTVGC